MEDMAADGAAAAVTATGATMVMEDTTVAGAIHRASLFSVLHGCYHILAC